jgi:catechol 2,3-dioxygenase-like lactoylglutathione lyase family enzyme
MTDWRLDHVVIAVHDLAAATADYEQAGFTVTRGGTHPGGWTHNALIGLADGSYLELLAPTDIRFLKDPEAQSARNFLFALGEEGAVGLALTCDDLNAAVAAMQARGVAIESPRPGGRQRHDSVRLEWRIAMQERSLLPFFLQDLTPRSLRVPSETAAVTHANGALGVAEIRLATADPAWWMARLAVMLGPSEPGGGWTFGSTSLQVIRDPKVPNSPTFDVRLRTNGTAPGRFDPLRLHGARLRFAD